MQILVGGVYSERGATAQDALDGDLTANIITEIRDVNGTIIGAISTATPTTYSVADAAGNVGTAQRVVVILAEDTIAPVIVIRGDNPLSMRAGTGFVDPGATAFDYIDGDLTPQIVVDAGALDTTLPGSYDVLYSVVDAAGNVGSGTREVIVTPPLRGDCNRDGLIDAGDISAIVLELFDGDGISVVSVSGGTFFGDAVGCDPTADLAIDALDLLCTQALVFDEGAICRLTE